MCAGDSALFRAEIDYPPPAHIITDRHTAVQFNKYKNPIKFFLIGFFVVRDSRAVLLT